MQPKDTPAQTTETMTIRKSFGCVLPVGSSQLLELPVILCAQCKYRSLCTVASTAFVLRRTQSVPSNKEVLSHSSNTNSAPASTPRHVLTRSLHQKHLQSEGQKKKKKKKKFS
jgi:hypothetical protein